MKRTTAFLITLGTAVAIACSPEGEPRIALPIGTPEPKSPIPPATRVMVTPTAPNADPRYDAGYWAEKYGIKETPPATGGQKELDNAIFGARETVGKYFQSRGLTIDKITGELGDVNSQGGFSVLITGRASDGEEFLSRNGKLTMYPPEQLANKGLAIAIDATSKDTKLWLVDQDDERTFDVFAGRAVSVAPPMTFGEIGANGEIKNQVASAKFMGMEALQMSGKNVLRNGERLVILLADYNDKGEILRIVTPQGAIDFSTNPNLRNDFIFDDSGLKPEQKRVIKPVPTATVESTKVPAAEVKALDLDNLPAEFKDKYAFRATKDLLDKGNTPFARMVSPNILPGEEILVTELNPAGMSLSYDATRQSFTYGNAVIPITSRTKFVVVRGPEINYVTAEEALSKISPPWGVSAMLFTTGNAKGTLAMVEVKIP